MRARCRAVFLDAGGVIVLPHGRLVADALARIGVEIDPSLVARAHYRAARRLDCDPAIRHGSDAYFRALCGALGVSRRRSSIAVHTLAYLGDRGLSGEILWSEPAPQALGTILALERVGIAVLIVTNSDGHAAANLRDAGICQTTGGPGVTVTDVIDSAVVGSAKPDSTIFSLALARAQVDASSVVHVGDMLSTDVNGARAAGILPLHLDPYRACRARDHRHVRFLNGIWSHVAPPAR